MKNANQLLIEIEPDNVPRSPEDKADFERVLASVSRRFGHKKPNWLVRRWRRLLNPRCSFCAARLEVVYSYLGQPACDVCLQDLVNIALKVMKCRSITYANRARK